jgi:hypothetical protein
LTRGVRTRSANLSDDGFTQGQGNDPAQSAGWEAEQRTALDELAGQLPSGRKSETTQTLQGRRWPRAAGYVVPVDPMDDLQCEGCQ